ncbi:hypothetical protein P4123_11485 [Pseudomonas aeruginosa]|nr:hypothetical protein [Pseudomonas aeruginosa]
MPSLAPRLYPNGFTPRITSDEDDYSADPRRPWRRAVRRLGLGPQLDLRRRPPGDRWTIRSTSPSTARPAIRRGPFDLLARYKATQWTNNLDLRRDFDLAWLPAR